MASSACRVSCREAGLPRAGAHDRPGRYRGGRARAGPARSTRRTSRTAGGTGARRDRPRAGAAASTTSCSGPSREDSGVPGTARSSNSADVSPSTTASSRRTAPRPPQARSPAASSRASSCVQPTLSTTSPSVALTAARPTRTRHPARNPLRRPATTCKPDRPRRPRVGQPVATVGGVRGRGGRGSGARSAVGLPARAAHRLVPRWKRDPPAGRAAADAAAPPGPLTQSSMTVSASRVPWPRIAAQVLQEQVRARSRAASRRCRPFTPGRRRR